MILKNSSSLTSPSPSRSASSIISCSSSSVMFSPSSFATRLRFLKEILPCARARVRARPRRVSAASQRTARVAGRGRGGRSRGGHTYGLVVVEEPEGLHDLLPRVPLAHLGRHHLQELLEVDGAGAVLVDVRDHLLDLLLLGLEAERAHRHLELLRVDRPGAVRVEEVEGLAEVGVTDGASAASVGGTRRGAVGRTSPGAARRWGGGRCRPRCPRVSERLGREDDAPDLLLLLLGEARGAALALVPAGGAQNRLAVALLRSPRGGEEGAGAGPRRQYARRGPPRSGRAGSRRTRAAAPLPPITHPQARRKTGAAVPGLRAPSSQAGPVTGKGRADALASRCLSRPSPPSLSPARAPAPAPLPRARRTPPRLRARPGHTRAWSRQAGGAGGAHHLSLRSGPRLPPLLLLLLLLLLLPSRSRSRARVRPSPCPPPPAARAFLPGRRRRSCCASSA